MYKSIYNFIRHFFKGRAILISGPAILTLLMCYALPCYANWQKSDIGFAFGEQEQIVVGDGRNDGIIRVYSGDRIGAGSGGNIYEFSFNGFQWEKGSFGGDNLCAIYGLNIGIGRNDGINRVYASGFNLGEYYFSDAWLGGGIGPYIQWTQDLVLGDARNDGKVRIYVAEWDKILELTYNNGNWNSSEINTGGQSIGKLIITDGRNDGVLRLYAATDWDDHVYEYTWSGSSWQVDDCGASGTAFFDDMAAGDGRNDGVNRIYLAAGWSGAYELSYDGNNWQYMAISDSESGTVAVGNGRSDNLNRVYIGNSEYMEEYTYSAGIWSKTSDIDSGLKVNEIAIGSGRNDDMNRVYVTSDDNHVYEYSFEVPVPDIEANGSDGPVTINQGDLLAVTVSLDPDGYDGQDADWWVAATSPFGLYWFTLDSGWIRSDTPIRVYGGPLFDLSPFTILEMSTLPVGNYTFYFAVDDNMDGVLDATCLDSVPVTVQ